MCVYVWGTVTDLLHSACSVLALKGETESSGEHTAVGDTRHRHSSCLTDSRAVSFKYPCPYLLHLKENEAMRYEGPGEGNT